MVEVGMQFGPFVMSSLFPSRVRAQGKAQMIKKELQATEQPCRAPDTVPSSEGQPHILKAASPADRRTAAITNSSVEVW